MTEKEYFANYWRESAFFSGIWNNAELRDRLQVHIHDTVINGTDAYKYVLAAFSIILCQV